jgi:hypothetical protein
MEVTSDTEEQKSFWCVVANIKKEHAFGHGGRDTKFGTKQFRGGAKVYISGRYYGHSAVCVGLQRYTRRFICFVVQLKHLENYRAKVVYQPQAQKLIEAHRHRVVLTQEMAERWAIEFAEYQP